MAHGILDEVVGIAAAAVSSIAAMKASGAKPNVGEAVKTAFAQRMPQMFGIGRGDEQIFEALRQLVDSNKRGKIDIVMKVMASHEKDIFCLTVAGMPCGGKLEDKPVKDPKKGQPTSTKEKVSWEFTENDLRVKYLNDVADEVINVGGDEKAARKVVKAMRDRDLITRNEYAQKIYDVWARASNWAWKNLCQFFGVKNLDEITEKKLTAGIKKAKAWLESKRIRKNAEYSVRHEKRNKILAGIWMFVAVIAAITAATHSN